MSGSWWEAYRLHRLAYPELAYHAIHAVRQGNILPQTPTADLVRKATTRALQSKLLVSGLLMLVALGSLALLRPSATIVIAPSLDHGLYVATVFSGLLVLDLALLWWTGLQVLPAFIASGILPTLDILPIPKQTVDRAALLLFLRLFDLPVFTILLVTPIVAALTFGSAVAGLAILPGVVAVVVFALALSLATGRFFVRHVLGSPGGRDQTVLRWLYLVLWATPAFAMYGFITLGTRVVSWISAIAASGQTGALASLFAAFPFPLAALPGLLSADGSVRPPGGSSLWAVLGLSGIAYLAAAAFVGRWLVRAPAGFSRTSLQGWERPTRAVRLMPRTAPIAILVKDLRVASRTPGFAFLILLPLLNGVAIGIWTLLAGPSFSDVFNIGAAAVATAALLATFFGPAFFAIETMGFAYTRSLPLSDRSLIAGKVLLILLVYVGASAVVLGISLVRVFDPVLFAAFIAAELPAVASAALLEFGVLTWAARRRGMPITNLYSGGWWAMAVSIPGVIVAGLPLAAFQLARDSSISLGLLVMGSIGLLELAGLGGPVLFGAGRSGR